jgi:hypothetical protein
VQRQRAPDRRHAAFTPTWSGKGHDRNAPGLPRRRHPGGTRQRPEAGTAWPAWVNFAGIMMIMLGFFQAAHRVWSILIIALDVVIISALAVHGREARAYDA